jgi:hypothetical protein
MCVDDFANTVADCSYIEIYRLLACLLASMKDDITCSLDTYL